MREEVRERERDREREREREREKEKERERLNTYLIGERNFGPDVNVFFLVTADVMRA